MFDTQVIESHEKYQILKDEFGITKKVLLTGNATPLDLDFPIKNRRDWEYYKEHYESSVSKRLPARWDSLKETIKNRKYPLRLGGFPFGFLGFPRHLIGTTELFMMMYDDPGLVKDMNDFFLKFIMEYWDILIPELQPDIVLIWEDMASKTGSMISKEMFEEFLSPYYKVLVDFLQQHKVANIHVDSDGYIEELIPLWMVLQVTGIFPFERQAGNDLLRIRQNFPKLQVLGAVDKRVFTADKSFADIDDELEIVRQLLQQGGCIPHADHSVPDDACWKNFTYYRERLNTIIDE
jgi:uroporphyrinogen decarboxylase